MLCLTPSVAVHGVRAEEGLHQCPAGAQSHPAWRHTPEGGAGGEPQELPEESCSPGAVGGLSEGQTCRREPVLMQRPGKTLRFVLGPAGGAWSAADSDLPAGQ